MAGSFEKLEHFLTSRSNLGFSRRTVLNVIAQPFGKRPLGRPRGTRNRGKMILKLLPGNQCGRM
jgi:hypothetical protein